MFSKAEELQNWLHTELSTAQVTYRALGCARAKNVVRFRGQVEIFPPADFLILIIVVSDGSHYRDSISPGMNTL